MVVKATKKKLEELRGVKEVMTRYRNFESEFQRFSQSATQEGSEAGSQQKSNAKRLQELIEQNEDLKKRLQSEKELAFGKRQSIELELRNLRQEVSLYFELFCRLANSLCSKIVSNDLSLIFEVLGSLFCFIIQRNFHDTRRFRRKETIIRVFLPLLPASSRSFFHSKVLRSYKCFERKMNRLSNS